jgi:hypothetical protein
MKYLLILQFPGNSIADFDELVEMEEALEKGLGPTGEIDGHDFGSSEGNIFISTSDPQRAFKSVKELLGISALDKMKAAFRPKEGEDYTVLWPPELKTFAVK